MSTRSPLLLSLLVSLSLAACTTPAKEWDSGEGPAGTDQDEDGYPASEDCDDQDPAIHPDAVDPWYDGVDSDCMENDDYDADQDSFVPSEYAGLATFGVAGTGFLPEGDCWDDLSVTPAEFMVVLPKFTDRTGAPVLWTPLSAAQVHPGSPDTWYDGVDQDCAGDDDFDQDKDGWRTDAYPDRDGAFGEDCLDGSPLDPAYDPTTEPSDIHPHQEEIWYDGIDQDCDRNDCDQDGDGYAIDGLGLGLCPQEECDDTRFDASIWDDSSNRGVDDNCDGTIDEESIVPGVLVITEINKNSTAGSDPDSPARNTDANWIELYNPGSSPIYLANWVLVTCTSSAFSSPTEPAWDSTCTLGEVAIPAEAGLVVEAGARLTLCQNATLFTLPERYHCDHDYGDSARWTGSSPAGVDYAVDNLGMGSNGILSIKLGELTIDEVGWYLYTEKDSWPNKNSRSMCLRSDFERADLNDDKAAWGFTSGADEHIWTSDPIDNRGTPGVTNLTPDVPTPCY